MSEIYPTPEKPEDNAWVPEPDAASDEVIPGSSAEGTPEAAPEASEQPSPPPGAENVTQPASNQAPLSPGDERTWAMLAHLSVLVNLVTGFLGPVVALIIYLVFRDRSRFVAYHAMQSFVFQLVWWVGGVALITIMWVITGLLSAIIIGLLCIPFAILGSLILGAMPLVALIYGVIGAIEVNQGRPFKYWLTGDWVNNSLM